MPSVRFRRVGVACLFAGCRGRGVAGDAGEREMVVYLGAPAVAAVR